MHLIPQTLIHLKNKMMTSKEKYLEKISGQESEAIKAARYRIENRERLHAEKMIQLQNLIDFDNWNNYSNNLMRRYGEKHR